MVPKSNGSLQLCNNFRKLNQVSEFDSYPIPQVHDLIKHLRKAQFISTLNLIKGYWPVALTPVSRPKTAFSTTMGHWQYQVFPLGLHGTPAIFKHLMDIMLWPHQSYTTAYLDDMMSHSYIWQEHLHQLKEVLSKVLQAKPREKPSKCHLGLAEAQYLSYCISQGLWKSQEKMIKAIKNKQRTRYMPS